VFDYFFRLLWFGKNTSPRLATNRNEKPAGTSVARWMQANIFSAKVHVGRRFRRGGSAHFAEPAIGDCILGAFLNPTKI